MTSFVDAMNEKLNALSSHVIKYKIAVSKYSLAQLTTPISLFLSNCDVARAFSCDDEIDEAEHKCSALIELDLGANHLTQWPEVFKIMDKMPKLSILNLSGNKLSAIVPNDGLPKYTTLNTLVLNRTHISWTDIGKLLEIVPQLKELHLSANNFRGVAIDTIGCEKEMTIVTSHENLERLCVDNNPIRDWSEVLRFGRCFPKLCSLSLSGCPIASFDCSMGEIGHVFPELDYLNVNDTKMNSWDDIFRLRELVKLRKLCIRRLPLFDAYTECKHTVWKLVAGLLPALQILNNSVISKEDRWDANALIEIEFHRIRS